MNKMAMVGLLFGWLAVGRVEGEEPPSLNPFAPRSNVREDALPGCVTLSNGASHAGQVYTTRDARLQIYDGDLQRQREVPLKALQRIDCTVEKEWLEREWRFKENANDEKVYTGRSYPARIYGYTLTLKDGRKISGPLSGILYVDSGSGEKPAKLLLHKRDKGPIGMDLPSLVYVRTVEFGEEARERGLKATAADAATGASSKSPSEKRRAKPSSETRRDR